MTNEKLDSVGTGKLEFDRKSQTVLYLLRLYLFSSPFTAG